MGSLPSSLSPNMSTSRFASLMHQRGRPVVVNDRPVHRFVAAIPQIWAYDLLQDRQREIIGSGSPLYALDGESV